MAGRIVPVQDRCITAVQRKLLTIQEANGYQNSLTSVHRRPGDVWRATNPPEIYLYFGRSRMALRTGGGETSGTEDRVYEGLTMQVRAFTTAPDEDCDREGSILLADIQKCLSTVHQPIKDPFYAVHGDIYVKPLSSMIGYPAAGSQYVVAVYFVELLYWRMASEPALWDADDAVVHEEQLLQESFP